MRAKRADYQDFLTLPLFAPFGRAGRRYTVGLNPKVRAIIDGRFVSRVRHQHGSGVLIGV